MATTIRARYADGVLIPFFPLDLEVGCEFDITVEEQPVSRSRTDTEQALLTGWLKEVNWHRGAAQLHDSAGSYVSLRFDPPQANAMRRLATQYVEVRGSGRFNDQGEWTTVHVVQLRETPAWSEPFDLHALLNDPNPKLFNPDKLVPIDLTDEEWEAFNRAIREGREA